MNVRSIRCAFAPRCAPVLFAVSLLVLPGASDGAVSAPATEFSGVYSVDGGFITGTFAEEDLPLDTTDPSSPGNLCSLEIDTQNCFASAAVGAEVDDLTVHYFSLLSSTGDHSVTTTMTIDQVITNDFGEPVKGLWHFTILPGEIHIENVANLPTGVFLGEVDFQVLMTKRTIVGGELQNESTKTVYGGVMSLTREANGVVTVVLEDDFRKLNGFSEELNSEESSRISWQETEVFIKTGELGLEDEIVIRYLLVTTTSGTERNDLFSDNNPIITVDFSDPCATGGCFGPLAFNPVIDPFGGIAAVASTSGRSLAGGTLETTTEVDGWTLEKVQQVADEWAGLNALNGSQYDLDAGVLVDASATDDEGEIVVEDPIEFVTGALLTKTLTSGPDMDDDGQIDRALLVGQNPVEYGFQMALENPDAAYVVLDTLPAEWSILVPELDSTVSSDNGDLSASSAGMGKKRQKATKIEWFPPEHGESFADVLAELRVSQSKKKDRFEPACGRLVLNNGAQAFDLDPVTNAPAVDENGVELPPVLESEGLCLVVVEDLDGVPGIARDGSGDEDQDGVSDLTEACELMTSPCSMDTDGDGCFDGADPRPLAPSEDNDNDGLGADCDVDDGAL